MFSILILTSNLILFFTFRNTNMMPSYLDVDRKSNGNTLICSFSFSEIINYPNRIRNQLPVPENSLDHKIFEIDQNRNKIWELTGLAQPHEVVELPNDHLLIADTGYDRVIEINYPNKSIIWEWKPELINWSKVNSNWDSNHYYNNPIAFDWTHLNDIDFKDYGTWNACLISIRNFDIIVEINYTAEISGPSNNPDNIFWYYGDYGNYSLLNHQHNPDYLNNGNIIIADSENNRILEINYTTKKEVWRYKGDLDWPRDADELPNGNLLITDSLHNRIIELDRNTKEIVWKFHGDLINPYEADLLENGNILVGNGIGGVVYEINKNGIEIWRYGLSYLKSVVCLNSIISIMIGIIIIYHASNNIRLKDLDSAKKTKNYLLIGFSIGLIVLNIIVMFIYTSITILIFRILFGRAR
ncbi:MAG: PQQ-binding-like beta-propeller repeat protein [Candidatus Heimdallarchaeota archaeon]